MREKYKNRLKNFRFLFSHLYRYQKSGVILPLQGCLAKVILAVVVIYVPKRVLDLVERQVEPKRMLIEVVFLTGLLAVTSIWNNVVHNNIDKCSQTFLYRRLIPMWQRSMITMEYEVLASASGKIKAQKAKDTIESSNHGVVSFLPAFTQLLENMAGLVSFSMIIGMLHPGVLLVLFLFFGVEMWYTARMEGKKHSLQEKRARANRKLNYLAYETRGMRDGKDIRIYGMVPWLKRITEAVVREKDAIEKQAGQYQKRALVLTGVLILLRDGLAYAFLIMRFLHTEMELGDFVLYFSAITGLGNWLTGLAAGAGRFSEADFQVQSLREFVELSQKTEAQDTEISLEAPFTFTFENVSFSYIQEGEERQEIPVLKNLNLTIKPGEKLAIVGVNGAGKTTLVKLLCGMLSPKEGRILVNGVDVRHIPNEKYYALFSAVFQHSGVLPVSIAENVMLNMGEKQDTSKLWKVLEQAGLEATVRNLPKKEMTKLVKEVTDGAVELSGGQLQRLLLARALYKDAPVLILDEPTAALDPLAESEIYERYHKLTEGKTAVFISHRLASTRFCDRVLMMEAGKIIEEGTHKDLMNAAGKYAQMFQIQSRYYQEGSVRAE